MAARTAAAASVRSPATVASTPPRSDLWAAIFGAGLSRVKGKGKETMLAFCESLFADLLGGEGEVHDRLHRPLHQERDGAENHRLGADVGDQRLAIASQ